MSYSHATNANITYLTDLIPGLPRAAAEAWLRCEGQAVNNPTNPLNILYYGSNARGQVGERGRFAVYTSAYRGLADAAWVVKNLSYYAHLRSVLARHPSALDAARAIEDSPWAGGHYGGKGKKDGCIVRNLGGTTGGPVVTQAQAKAQVQRVQGQAGGQPVLHRVRAPHDVAGPLRCPVQP